MGGALRCAGRCDSCIMPPQATSTVACPAARVPVGFRAAGDTAGTGGAREPALEMRQGVMLFARPRRAVRTFLAAILFCAAFGAALPRPRPAARGVPGGAAPPPSGLRATREPILMTDIAKEPQGAALGAAEGAEEGIVVDFPEPLTPLERLERTATFWGRAVPVLVNYFKLYSSFELRKAVFGDELDASETRPLWEAEHERGAQIFKDTIDELKGFYTKCGQIIAARQDLFPAQYTEKLAGLTDFVDPMPTALVKAVVSQELLQPLGLSFADVFAEFDEAPLGAASVAQVHRAVLSEAYGGGEVAVKVQRPAIEPKLMSDVANLKALAKQLRPFDAIPVDYYLVFSELERQLAEEFNFVAEAEAMRRIDDTINFSPSRAPRQAPLVVPKPVEGLVSKRVLVMDLLKGVPLSRAQEEMRRRGVDPDGPEAKLFARRLLAALTTTFGQCILETGFFHADPHPGNIFVTDEGEIGLIDYGQVKEISRAKRETLAKVMVALSEAEGAGDDAMAAEDITRIGDLALELGVELKEDAKAEGPAAVAVWLFDGARTALPGGYASGELDPNSPVKELASFPQELVLVGRATVLIKGIAARLGIEWSLAREWAPIAKQVLGLEPEEVPEPAKPPSRARRAAEAIVRRLPPRLRTRVVAAMLRREERREARRAEGRGRGRGRWRWRRRRAAEP